jgi:hypothetical protein
MRTKAQDLLSIYQVEVAFARRCIHTNPGQSGPSATLSTALLHSWHQALYQARSRRPLITFRPVNSVNLFG